MATQPACQPILRATLLMVAASPRPVQLHFWILADLCLLPICVIRQMRDFFVDREIETYPVERQSWPALGIGCHSKFPVRSCRRAHRMWLLAIRPSGSLIPVCISIVMLLTRRA